MGNIIIFFFFIPEALLMIFGGLCLVGLLFVNEITYTVCNFCHNNFWIFPLITFLILIAIAFILVKSSGILSGLAYIFASSQIIVLFLDTLDDIFVMGLDFMGNGLLAIIIVAPILIIYTLGNLFAIVLGIGNLETKTKSLTLWSVGIIGWLLNIFVWS